MLKLTKGQAFVLAVASTPMAVIGAAGAYATYVNMNNVLHRGASALGLVAAGEGATLICALVALAVTLMGQHTPATVRVGMWAVPLIASAAGIVMAPTTNDRVTMAVTPLAMTAAGEGVAFVARRVVAYQTGVDIEQQRRSGLLLWHANRAANGHGLGAKRSQAAVWRLTRRFAETDGQLSVQLGEIQRYRIGEGADANLAAVLSGSRQTPAVAPAAPRPAIGTGEGATGPQTAVEGDGEVDPQGAAGEPDAGWMDLADALTEAESNVKADATVKLLTTSEVAQLKGVADGTVRSWKHRGKLAPHAVVDGTPMYHPVDVAKLD